jgi:hypothetical protein
MGKGRFAASAAAALFAALALAACGSSNNNGSSADQSQITAAITAAATSGDPSACTKYQTQHFVEQTNNGTGEAAVKSCEQDAKQTAADKVVVHDISVDGDTATAKADATGSIFDGQTLDIGLVKQNGQWKLDQFKGFVNFDKAAMVAAFPAELQKEGQAPAGAVSCLQTQLQKTPDQTIENSFVNNDQQAQNQIFGPCAKYFKGG